MIEFEHNVYELRVADLDIKLFPFSKILQTKYGIKNAFREFKDAIKKYLKELPNRDNLDLVEIKQEILLIKNKLMVKYPNEFPKQGWYDLQVWKERNFSDEDRLKLIKRAEAKAVKLARKLAEQDRFDKLMEKKQKEQEEKDSFLKETIIKGLLERNLYEFYYQDVKTFIKHITASDLERVGFSFTKENNRKKFKLTKG